MQSSGNSEFSDSNKQTYSLNFWQSFLLTLFGATGLISIVADFPRWITYPLLILVIVLLLSVIKSNKKSKSGL